MDADCFFDVYNDLILRQYLIDTCKAFSKLPGIQEDLLQEAWMRIAESDADCVTDYYMLQGFRAIHAYYERELRYRKHLDEYREQQENHNMHRRINRVAKRYEKKIHITVAGCP
jgi:DNA-directed RNA polymerase specialized sigma24 family protein